LENLATAMELMENNETEKALEIVENVLKTADEQQLFFIGEFYWHWGFYEQAKDVFIDLIEHFPEESELKVMLADIYIELNDDQQAIQILTDIPADDSFYLQSLVQLADLYTSEGLLEVAEQKLLEAQEIAPDEPIITFALAEFFFSTGDFKRSTIFYEKLYPEHEEIAQISIVNRLAEVYASTGEYEKALTFYQKQDLNNPDDIFKYALTAYQAKRPEIAISNLERLLEIDDNYHSAYFELAKVYNEEEMIEEALQTCEKGLLKDNFNKELYYIAGTSAHKLNDLTRSEKYLREAILLDPDYKQAIVALQSIFAEEERYEEIIDLIDTIKEQDAFDPEYDWMLASAHYNEENYERASKYYEKAYPQLQEESEFLKEYGYFLAEEGYRDNAVHVLKQYLSIQEDEDVTQFVERMTSDMEDF